ncbi:MAG: helix-turn-helix domain-containing protein [Defluviitaleaceae bacterium]|nr:helix-turn-helix domain-containing protein [Defluviitaleaceae bacterium]
MYSEVFPSRLKGVRESHGFTQLEVSKELNINNASISHYEKGIRQPDIETLSQFADFYGASVDWLIGVRAFPGKREHFLDPESKWDGMKIRSTNFPTKMKIARTDMRLSQIKAAAGLKIPQSTLAKYELGKLQPNLEVLARITIFYNVSADWLLGISDVSSPLLYEQRVV